MRLLYVPILILFAGCSSRKTKVAETYPDGKPKIEFIYKKPDDINGNKLITGKRILYDSLGNIAQTDDLVDGKLNGEEIWYYPNGKIWMLTKVRNDSAYGFEYEFSETGDTLKAEVHYGLSVKGVFYKKWLPNQIVLTGNYGDSDRTFVVWKWIDKDSKELKRKVDSGILVDNDFKRFMAPE